MKLLDYTTRECQYVKDVHQFPLQRHHAVYRLKQPPKPLSLKSPQQFTHMSECFSCSKRLIGKNPITTSTWSHESFIQLKHVNDSCPANAESLSSFSRITTRMHTAILPKKEKKRGQPGTTLHPLDKGLPKDLFNYPVHPDPRTAIQREYTANLPSYGHNLLRPLY